MDKDYVDMALEKAQIIELNPSNELSHSAGALSNVGATVTTRPNGVSSLDIGNRRVLGVSTKVVSR